MPSSRPPPAPISRSASPRGARQPEAEIALPRDFAPAPPAEVLAGLLRPFLAPDNSADLRRILAAPRLPLGQWPTPIETVSIEGSSLLVKRDDLSGFGRGGAKTRKLEHVLGLLRARGNDELITVVGNITNLGFDLLPALRAHGFTARIFVQDDPPLPPALRASCFAGIADELHFLGRSRVVCALRVGFEWLRRRGAGRKPFLLLPGASHPAGVLGNATGFIEMVQQLQSAGERLPTTVFVSVATGTTLAGFLLAQTALRRAGGPPIRIVGVQVYPGNVARRTRLLLRWTERHLALEHHVDPRDIEIHAEPSLRVFGQCSPGLDALCHRVRDATQLQLDPIFGGKTWAAMERELAARPADGPVMFWHCGHTPEWQPLVNAVRQTAPSAPGLDAMPPPAHAVDAAPRIEIAITPEPPAAAAASPPLARKLAILAIYATSFYGLLPLLLWSVGRQLDRAFALPPFPASAVGVLGSTLLTVGAAIILLSTNSLLRIGRGLPISHLPPTTLVQRGLYRWTRHPHYVGYTLAFAGCGVLAGSWGINVGAGALLLSLWLIYAVMFEEPRLVRRFGAPFESYRRCVRILPAPPLVAWFARLIARSRRPLEALANRLVLFRTGSVLWVTYGAFCGLGAAAMGFGFTWYLVGLGSSGFTSWWSVTLVALMIALSSRMAWLLLPGDKPAAPARALLRNVGFLSWGGYAGALTTVIVLGRMHGIAALRMLDIAMITGLFASCIGRWGCFAYGCCIGRPVSWGIHWRDPDSWIQRLRPGAVEPRLPTQILSSLHAGAAGLILVALSFLPTAPGALMAVGALGYGLPRFAVEHLREEARFTRWQLTSGQFGAGAMALMGLVLLLCCGDPQAALWPRAVPAHTPLWLLASAATCFVIVFVPYSIHWKRIGRW